MNKLFEDLARAVGKALAMKWISNLREKQTSDDSRKIQRRSPKTDSWYRELLQFWIAILSVNSRGIGSS